MQCSGKEPLGNIPLDAGKSSGTHIAVKLKITTSDGNYWLRAGRFTLGFHDLASAIDAAKNHLMDSHYLVMQGYTNSGIVLHA